MIEEYPNKLLSLTKERVLPFVVFNGKADESEKISIYLQAYEDIINLIKQRNEKINN